MTDTHLNNLADAFPLARQVLELASRVPVRTLATAESCTAGLLAAAITSVAGSSRIFLGGVVAYANSVKMGWLAVPESILEAQGAVSQEVAEAMAMGVRAGFGASLGIATTGVAGPGSSESKPAGLIYVALAGPDGVEVRQLDRDLGRHLNRVAAVEVALEMAVGALQ
ncbi:MAG TPA: CinA family protein [Candidatus Saccharimonadales bacterium]|nr:CinA family protein [Candidatus Saccharimonadales bacterium]